MRVRAQLEEFASFESVSLEWEYDAAGREQKILVVLLVFDLAMHITPYGDDAPSAEMRAIRDALVPQMESMGLHRIRLTQTMT